jgi:PAS domain S-box-containing protein
MEGQPLNASADSYGPIKSEEAAGWLSAIVASSCDAIVSNTPDGTVTSWNKAATKLFGYCEEEIIGQSIRRLIPEDRQDEENQMLARIAAGECIEDYETVRQRKDGSPIDVSVTVSPLRDGDGTIVGVSRMARDITRRKQAEDLQRKQDSDERRRTEEALRESKERQSFLLALSDALRGIADPIELMATASELLGRKLGAGQVTYADVDETGEHATVSRDWNDRAIPRNAAIYRLEDFGAAFVADLKQGQTAVINDVRTDPRTCAPEALALFERISFVSFIDVPLVKAGRLVAILAVHMRAPRDWRQDEVVLVQEVAERTWGAVERARAEQALRESEERLRFSLKGAGAAAWQWDIASNKLVWSPESYELHGRDPKLGPPRYEDWLQCLHPDDRARVGKAVFDAVEKRAPEYRAEFRVVLPCGEVRWLDGLGKVDYAADGKPVRMSGINLDITARKLAQRALHESEEWFRLVLKSSGAGAWQWYISTNEMFASLESFELHGRADRYGERITYEDWAEAVYPEDRARAEKAVADTFEKRAPEYANEYRIVLPSGEVRWVNVLGNVDYAEDGAPLRISGISLDITERKRSEEALRESEEHLRFALDAANAGTWESVPETGEFSASDRALAMHGLPPGLPMTHEKALAAVHPEDRPRVQEALRRTFERGELYSAEYRVPLPDGSIRWIETRGELRSVSGRQVIGGLVLDITERKKSAEEALASRSRLEAALASMADAVCITDSQGWFVHFNEAFAAYQRFSSKEDSAKTLAEYSELFDVFLPNGELAPLEQWAVPRALRGETAKQAEYTMRRKDTGETWVGSYNFAPIRNSKGEITGAVVTARDITRQKLAEQKLREREARLSSIIDTAADSIIVSDDKGTIQSANPATAGIFGYGLEDLIGQNIRILVPAPMRAQHDRYVVSFSGSSGLREIQGQRKSGEIVPIDRTLTEWWDGQGRRFFTGIFRDVTERKRNEEALANARRLEAVGQLAGGVAHDFNNLLHVISGYLEIARDCIGDETARGFLDRARSAAEKGGALNQRLLSLARKRSLKPQRLNLNERVQDIATLLATTVGEHISVTTELAADLWPTLADPGEIDSAILNLAANARDAMPGGGNIRISTSNATLDAAAAAKLHLDARPGGYARLAIADDGPGMPADVLAKAFEPFFTTKGQGVGTGLGLASVASFAKQTGGFATIESASGQGCAVSVYLPRATKKSSARATIPREIQQGAGELVLVVEDDDLVREVTIAHLESLGYAVIEAKTGPEAIERLKSQEPIRLILSDIVMPGGMTGYDVMRWAAANKPDLKVILCSGYNEVNRTCEAGGALDGVDVLGKPYTCEQLASAVSGILR